MRPGRSNDGRRRCPPPARYEQSASVRRPRDRGKIRPPFDVNLSWGLPQKRYDADDPASLHAYAERDPLAIRREIPKIGMIRLDADPGEFALSALNGIECRKHDFVPEFFAQHTRRYYL